MTYLPLAVEKQCDCACASPAHNKGVAEAEVWYWVMNAAKDLLKRAVELDSAQKYSEALICYEEGIQNLLRAMGGKRNRVS